MSPDLFGNGNAKFQFLNDPPIVYTMFTYKHFGLANKKIVKLIWAVARRLAVVLLTTKTKKQNKATSLYHKSVMCNEFGKMSKSVKNQGEYMFSLTPTLPSLPSLVKEELCSSALPSPTSQQPRVKVRMREGQAVNIHMLCARRPGLLFSAMRAIEGLGLCPASCYQLL